MPKSVVKLRQYGVRVNGILIRKSFASASAARAWQRSQKKQQDDVRAGLTKPLDPTLLALHAVDFLNSRKEQSSFQHQEIWMGKYILTRPAFKDKFLHELTRQHWKEVFGEKGELVQKHGLSPGTHNRVRSMIHKMYEDARREYEPPRCLDNPIHDIPPLKEPKRAMPVLNTVDNISAYIEAAYRDACPAWGIYSMIKLNTGLRQSNVIAIRWADIDLEHRVIWVRMKRTRAKGLERGTKKNEDDQSIGINDALYEALIAHKAKSKHTAPEDWVCAQADGSPLMYWHVPDRHKRTLKRAGLPYISEHKLRHTYATHYVRNGGSLHDLKLNLFHSSITVTEKYAQNLPEDLGRRASRFQIAPPAAAGVTPIRKNTKK